MFTGRSCDVLRFDCHTVIDSINRVAIERDTARYETESSSMHQVKKRCSSAGHAARSSDDTLR
ncbi:MAG: hypothetical protein WC379_18175 [Methanoregula sp.]